ncbi:MULTISPECIES: hypothetical protein [unclassified Vibrio]|nr:MULTISPECIES: hypothetical protein [unclassified Vibrio]
MAKRDINSSDLKMQDSDLHQQVQFKKDNRSNGVLFQGYLVHRYKKSGN